MNRVGAIDEIDGLGVSGINEYEQTVEGYTSIYARPLAERKVEIPPT